MPDRNKPVIPEEILTEPSSVKQMLRMDIYFKQELDLMFRLLAKRLTWLLTLTSVCTIAIIVIFFFYFTRPTKTDILVFKQIQMERMMLKDERKIVDDLRDSLKKDRTELFKLQQKK